MPEVVDCAGDHFTSTDVNIFGAEIPISACMADQVSNYVYIWMVITIDIYER